jgi:type II secretory ATPase GspE/PulE/Tfp pilus assembly ATPase PilB-like protein
MEDPDDIEAVDTLQKVLGTNMRTFVANRSNINTGIDRYRENIGTEITKVVSEEDQPTEEEVKEEDIAEDSPIAQTVNLIIEYAIRSGASDVHIEPREQYVSVRYRVDGILKEVNRLPKKIMAALISRIKILSNLKIDERRVPQDGRLKIAVGDKSWSLRVSTLPIMEGEKVVMRIEPFLIASTVRAVIGQRLVRRLCVVCRERYTPDETQLQGITKLFKLDDPKTMARFNELEKQALAGGVGKSEDESANELSTTDKAVKYLWRAHKGGCDACSHNGYKGRVGIYEALGNSEEIQAMIVGNSTSEKIQQQAMAEGMITMQMEWLIFPTPPEIPRSRS